MIDALYIAESGLEARQKQLNAIAHNIANLSTPGFKTNNINFMAVVQQSQNEKGDIAQSTGIGVSAMPTLLDMKAGNMEHTGRALDIALNGPGFFEVNLPNGDMAYSRGGQMKVDNQGYLSTDSGFRLNAMVQIPPDITKLTVTQDGQIQGTLNEGRVVDLGQLQLVSFTNTTDIHAIGSNLFMAGASALESANYGTPGEGGMAAVMQGMLESSNVEMNQQMLNMMMAQRSYQLNARIVQVSDQILEVLNNLRR